MKYKQRKRLEEKSMKAFGVKSRWYTLWKKGKVVNGKYYWLTLIEVEEIMDKAIQTKEQHIE